MLKTEYIDIFMTTTNKSNFYNKKGYKCKKGDVVKINVYDLGKYDKTFKGIDW